jgi:hypothetical protein
MKGLRTVDLYADRPYREEKPVKKIKCAYLFCKRMFEQSGARPRYCSTVCELDAESLKARLRAKVSLVTCQHCHALIHAVRRANNNPRIRYCSDSCAKAAWYLRQKLEGKR